MRDLCIHGIGTLIAKVGDNGEEAADRLPSIPIKDYLKPVQTRRFGRLAKLMYVAARRALDDAGIEVDDSLGIVTATAMGEVDVSVSLIEQIYHTRGVTLSPKLIPNSVHNSPAGYLTISLGSHAPAITVSQGWLSVEAALSAAEDLMATKMAEKVLLVVGDEYSPEWSARLKSAGAVALADSLSAQQFTEGAAALVLGADASDAPRGKLRSSLTRFDGTAAGLRGALERLECPLSANWDIRVRRCAGGPVITELLSELIPIEDLTIKLDEGWAGSSLARALAVITDQVRSGSRAPMVTLGMEVDDLGIVYWRGGI